VGRGDGGQPRLEDTHGKCCVGRPLYCMVLELQDRRAAASPSGTEESTLSALLSAKVREQAKEIQELLDKVEALEAAANTPNSRPPCLQVQKPVYIEGIGTDNVLTRDGVPSFKDHNQILKQLFSLTREYNQVNKKLEDVISEKKQLRTELNAKVKESASLHRQLLAVQKVLADTKASYKEDLCLDVSSPVAGRRSNASADRQAIAKLVKTVKSLQGTVEGLEQEKRALQVRLEAVEATAREEAAYTAALKQALNARSVSSAEHPAQSDMLEELVKARAAILALRQHNTELLRAAESRDVDTSAHAESGPKGTPHRKAALDTIQRHAEESVLLRQEIARLEGEKAALLEHLEEAERERETLNNFVQSAEDSTERARAEASQTAAVCRKQEEEAEALARHTRELSDKTAHLTSTVEELRGELADLHGARDELLAVVRETKAALSTKEREVEQHEAAALQTQQRAKTLADKLLVAQEALDAQRVAANEVRRKLEGDCESARRELHAVREEMRGLGEDVRQQRERQAQEIAEAHDRCEALETHKQALLHKIEALETLAADREQQCAALQQAATRRSCEWAAAEAAARKVREEMHVMQQHEARSRATEQLRLEQLEAQLEAALRDKLDVEHRFGALMAINDMSITRIHSPPQAPGSVLRHADRSPPPSLLNASQQNPAAAATCCGDALPLSVAAGGAGESSGERADETRHYAQVQARGVDVGDGGVHVGDRAGGGPGVDSNFGASACAHDHGQPDAGNLEGSAYHGNAAHRVNRSLGPSLPPGRAAQNSSRWDQGPADMPTPRYATTELGERAHTIGGQGKAGGGREQDADSFPVAMPSSLLSASSSLLTSPSALPLASGAGSRDGRAKMDKRSSDLRNAAIEEVGDLGGVGGVRRVALLPSPPSLQAAALRRGLLDENELYMSPHVRDAASKARAVRVGTGSARGRSDGNGAESEFEGQSVAEKLHNIHSTFAAMRGQAGLCAPSIAP
jgi:hypothetical protein